MAATLPDAPTVAATPQLAGGLRGRGVGNPRFASARGVARLLVALLIVAPGCFADTIRVTAWNLEPVPASGTNDTRIQDAATALKKLNPDVILLQQVRDWKMCERLAQALKPVDYSISICSLFRAQSSGASSN